MTNGDHFGGCVMETKWAGHRDSVIEIKWQEMGNIDGKYMGCVMESKWAGH